MGRASPVLDRVVCCSIWDVGLGRAGFLRGSGRALSFLEAREGWLSGWGRGPGGRRAPFPLIKVEVVRSVLMCSAIKDRPMVIWSCDLINMEVVRGTGTWLW